MHCAAQSVNEGREMSRVRQAQNRAEHESVELGVKRNSQELRTSVGAAEVGGHSEVAVEVSAQRGVPSVQIEMVEVRHVRAGIGTVILKTAKDFCPGRVFRQELKR